MKTLTLEQFAVYPASVIQQPDGLYSVRIKTGEGFEPIVSAAKYESKKEAQWAARNLLYEYARKCVENKQLIPTAGKVMTRDFVIQVSPDTALKFMLHHVLHLADWNPLEHLKKNGIRKTDVMFALDFDEYVPISTMMYLFDSAGWPLKIKCHCKEHELDLDRFTSYPVFVEVHSDGAEVKVLTAQDPLYTSGRGSLRSGREAAQHLLIEDAEGAIELGDFIAPAPDYIEEVREPYWIRIEPDKALKFMLNNVLQYQNYDVPKLASVMKQPLLRTCKLFSLYEPSRLEDLSEAFNILGAYLEVSCVKLPKPEPAPEPEAKPEDEALAEADKAQGAQAEQAEQAEQTAVKEQVLESAEAEQKAAEQSEAEPASELVVKAPAEEGAQLSETAKTSEAEEPAKAESPAENAEAVEPEKPVKKTRAKRARKAKQAEAEAAQEPVAEVHAEETKLTEPEPVELSVEAEVTAESVEAEQGEPASQAAEEIAYQTEQTEQQAEAVEPAAPVKKIKRTRKSKKAVEAGKTAEQAEEAAVPVEPAAEPAEQPKRKRGRPRKHPLPEAVTEQDTKPEQSAEDEPQQAKPRRGRRKKADVQEA